VPMRLRKAPKDPADKAKALEYSEKIVAIACADNTRAEVAMRARRWRSAEEPGSPREQLVRTLLCQSCSARLLLRPAPNASGHRIFRLSWRVGAGGHRHGTAPATSSNISAVDDEACRPLCTQMVGGKDR